MTSSNIYLDYAAATPMDPRVLKAMEPYLSTKFYNPSATYSAARSVRYELEEARGKIAVILGSRPAEIYFTSGATEANNLAIRGIAGTYPSAEILVSSIEHESVLAPAVLAGAKQVPVMSSGLIDLKQLAVQISEKTVLLSVMLVNNELGVVQPLRQIAGLVETERKLRRVNGNKLPFYLHTDAAQAANFLNLHVSRLAVDLMSVNGGKIYGPKQTGFLYVRAGIELAPQILGGGQEYGLRSGTENVAGIIGLTKALLIAQKSKTAESPRTRALLEELEAGLLKASKHITINGSKKHRAPHILSATFQGFDNERLMMEFDEKAIQVAVGSACSASKEEPSHVLSAIGLPEASAQSTLRFSLGRQTKNSDIEKVLKAASALLNTNSSALKAKAV